MVRPYATRPGARVASVSKHAEDPSLTKRKPVKVTDPGLLNRTAWTNAAVALDHIKKVRIMGREPCNVMLKTRAVQRSKCLKY